MRTRRRLPAAALAASAVLAFAGCGSTDPDGVLTGESEGVYVSLDLVKYQVQMSRILNPANTEDASYLQGVLPGADELDKGETWFGVWLRAENENEQPAPKASDFRIVDTLGDEFRPLVQANNLLTWNSQPRQIGPAGQPTDVIPTPNSISQQTTIQGSLLLFKIPYSALENRPLEFEIAAPTNTEKVAKINLDV